MTSVSHELPTSPAFAVMPPDPILGELPPVVASLDCEGDDAGPASTWPAWTDEERWFPVDPEVEAFEPTPEDEAFALGLILGFEADLADFNRFSLPLGRSYDEHFAFHGGFFTGRQGLVDRLYRDDPVALHAWFDDMERERIADALAEPAEVNQVESCGRC